MSEVAQVTCSYVPHALLGAIQVLRNAVGGWVDVSFLEKSVTKMCGSTLLALQGGGWGSIFQVKSVM